MDEMRWQDVGKSAPSRGSSTGKTGLRPQLPPRLALLCFALLCFAFIIFFFHITIMQHPLCCRHWASRKRVSSLIQLELKICEGKNMELKASKNRRAQVGPASVGAPNEFYG